jgi:hypothetical protein
VDLIEQIATLSRQLPGEKQKEVLDVVEFLASRQVRKTWMVGERQRIVAKTMGCLAGGRTSSEAFAEHKREEKAKDKRRQRSLAELPSHRGQDLSITILEPHTVSDLLMEYAIFRDKVVRTQQLLIYQPCDIGQEWLPPYTSLPLCLLLSHRWWVSVIVGPNTSGRGGDDRLVTSGKQVGSKILTKRPSGKMLGQLTYPAASSCSSAP